MKANEFRQLADELEIIEIQKHQESINIKVEKEEDKLRKRQQLSINSLMKRIQRDRDEQLIHRQTDSRVLIQRNKNVLADVIERQQVETKNTIIFLKYGLGKRTAKDMVGNDSVMDLSAWNGASVMSTTSFHQPKRRSVFERHNHMF